MNSPHIAIVGSDFANEEGLVFLSDQNLHEYDFIIIDSTSLIEELNDSNPNKIEKRIQDLREFIEQKNIPTVFLISQGGTFSPMGKGSNLTIPELLKIDVEEEYGTGRKIDIKSGTLFSDFLKKYHDDLEYMMSYSKVSGISIGNAKSKKNSIGFYNRDFVFLPTFNEDNNIDDDEYLRDLYNVCRNIRSEEVELLLPEWAQNYLLPGETEVRKFKDQLDKEIQKLVKQKAEAEIRLASFTPLKQLWTTNDRALELAVRLAFEELGFISLPTKENRSDIILKLGDQILIIEVKGLTKSAGEKNAAQLEKFISEYITEQEEDTNLKGILIVNAYRHQNLEERPLSAFPDQMLKYSIARDHCLLSTIQLCSLVLYCREHPEEKEEILKKLIQTTGIYTHFSRWQDQIAIIPKLNNRKNNKNKRN